MMLDAAAAEALGVCCGAPRYRLGCGLELAAKEPACHSGAGSLSSGSGSTAWADQ